MSILKRLLAKRLRSEESGFTLLELLVVVGILAIVGGALITSYDGLEGQAATGAATEVLAGLDAGVRLAVASLDRLPNNVESLMHATPGGLSGTGTGQIASTVTGTAATTMLSSKIDGKFTAATLSVAQLQSLLNAGINKIRYLDFKGVDETINDLDIHDVGGVNATGVGRFSEIDIPQHAFETPRPDGGKNRGRGFAYDLTDGTSPIVPNTDATAGARVLVWNAGTNGYNNIKVGGDASSVLVGFGIGHSSDFVGAGNPIPHAPFYGKVRRNEYNHYTMLVDVSVDPAKVVAIVDARGDFLDEEYAEATGQKL